MILPESSDGFFSQPSSREQVEVMLLSAERRLARERACHRDVLTMLVRSLAFQLAARFRSLLS